MTRRYAAALAALLSANLAPITASAEPSKPAERTGSTRTSVDVRVSSSASDLPADAVERAVRSEVERTLGAESSPTVVELTIDSSRSARALVRTANGETRFREIVLPEEPGAALEVLGLLCASLVRSDADALASELRGRHPRAPADSTSPSASAWAIEQAKDQETGDAAEAAPPTSTAPDTTTAGTDTPSTTAAPSTEATAPPKSEATATEAAKQPDEKLREVVPLHVTLWPVPNDQLVHLEFGPLYGRVGALKGFGFGGLVLQTDGDAEGVVVAGLWSEVGGEMRGFNAAGLVSRSPGRLQGYSVSGLLDLRGGTLRGGQVSGLYGSNLGAEGLQVSGLVSRSRSVVGAQVGGVLALAENTTGIQLGGVTALAGDFVGLQVGGVVGRAGNTEGIQVSGVYSQAAQLEGAQIAGVAALADTVHGAQIAGVTSRATKVEGVQIGVVNTAQRVRGAQIGVVNVADRVDGFPVGLVNAVGNGRNQLAVWYGGERMPINAALKYMHGPVYTLLALGAKPTRDSEQNVYGSGAGLGGRVKLYGDAFLELDGLWMYETRPEEPENGVQTVRGRAALGYEITPHLALFAGGGPLFVVDVDADTTDWEPHFFGGVQIF